MNHGEAVLPGHHSVARMEVAESVAEDSFFILYSDPAHTAGASVNWCISRGGHRDGDVMHHQPTAGRRTARTTLLAALTALVMVVLAAIPAGAMTVTFIRHGESEGNVSDYINTTVPGPGLTPTGQTQAQNVSAKLQGEGIDPSAFDNLYTSTMIRTQQTAAPLADELEKTPIVIGTFDPLDPRSPAGIQEIYAGVFENTSQVSGIGRVFYGLMPLGWALGLRFLRIPGAEDGNEFDARVDAALEQMRNDGDTNNDGQINVGAFSHGLTIMAWTLMNVDNPNLGLFFTHSLKNTDIVVVEENGDGGWTLKSWAGQEVGEADYLTKMLVNVRDLIVAPQTALYNMRQPVFDLDGRAIAETAAQGIRDVGEATVKFVKDSITDTVEEIRRHFPQSSVTTLTAKTAAPEGEPLTTTGPARATAVKQLDAERSEFAAKRAERRAEADAKRTARRDRIRATVTEIRDNVTQSVTDARDRISGNLDRAVDSGSGDTAARDAA
ncbi:hypothetical protein A5727_13255 [Mycobacterium sp. ACS4331]|nr:hypothetical protein A5727_13255 [Mycobacterium sp. ACS4331]